MASTHLELYRRFTGKLRPRRMAFWPILTSGLRVLTKRKFPLLVLYAIPAIATIVFSFFVYGKFAAEEQLAPSLDGGFGLTRMLAKQAMNMLEVKNQIIEFNIQMRLFALLAAAWFGSGLLCEDRRVGAHQLWFARPLTKLDYFLGKFLTAAFFGACAVLVPGLVICLVASFSSPNWSFLREEGDVVLKTLAYGVIWVTLVASVTLCASSLAPRRGFAMMGTFGFFVALDALAKVLGSVRDEPDLFALSPLMAVRQIGYVLFDKESTWPGITPWLAWTTVGVVTVGSLLVVAWRLRRLEVVR